MKICAFLRTIAPDFMWCSVFDMYLMYEQIDEDVEWYTFKETFHQLFRKGLFLSKPDARSKKRKLYIRKSERSKDAK